MLVDSHLGRGPAPYWRVVAENIEPNASPWRVGLGRLVMGSQKSRFIADFNPLSKNICLSNWILSPPNFGRIKNTCETFEASTYNNIANPVPFAEKKKNVTGRSPAKCYWTSSGLPEDAVLKHDRCDTSLISMPQPVVLYSELQK